MQGLLYPQTQYIILEVPPASGLSTHNFEKMMTTPHFAWGACVHNSVAYVESDCIIIDK